MIDITKTDKSVLVSGQRMLNFSFFTVCTLFFTVLSEILNCEVQKAKKEEQKLYKKLVSESEIKKEIICNKIRQKYGNRYKIKFLSDNRILLTDKIKYSILLINNEKQLYQFLRGYKNV